MANTELVVLEKIQPITIFSDGGADPLLDAIKKRVAEMPQDISTKEGREAIRSGAYEIARTKTTIDKMRLALVADEKARLKKIDAEGKRIWDELEALQHSYRAPLTAWEKQDEERIKAHEAALAALVQLGSLPDGYTSSDVQQRIDAFKSQPPRDWQEFAVRAEAITNTTLTELAFKLESRKQYEAEQAELERLRREEAERKQREHEERIAAEAAAKAKVEAEERARKDAEAEAVRVRAEQEKAERERQRVQREKEEAERQRVEAEERARKAEEARIAAEAKAEADRKAAAEKARLDAIAAAEKAKRDAEIAAQKERERIEAERKAEADATAKREADRKHRAKINNEILAAMLAIQLSDGIALGEADAKAIIQALTSGKIPHVKVQY